MQTLTTWIGQAVLAGTDQLVLGPDHPTRAGAVRLECDVDGGVIEAARVEIGWLHRGAEKLFEVRDYRQGLGLADRHDWQAPVVGELSLARAVETALGIEVPVRAVWLRTLAVEHARIHFLLGLLQWLGVGARECREGCRRQLADWTGSRLHPMLVRIGGVEYDVDVAWLDAEAALAGAVLGTLVGAEELIPAGLAGLAAVDRVSVDGLGLSGPTARAAGLARDLRRQRPHLAYAQLPPLELTETDGDAAARFRQLMAETRHAARLVVACCQRLRDSAANEIDVRLPKIIRLPEGEFYEPLEAPLGEGGLRVVSRGEKTPWRVMLRTPSQPHVLALEHLLPGHTMADVEPVVASLGWVIGDVDK